MATKTTSKKQQKSHHAAYAKQRNRSIHQKQRLQKVDEFNNYGIALLEAGRYEEAIKPLEQALAINPEDIGTLINYGTALQALNQDEEAIAYYEKALAIDPNHIDALNNYGDALNSLNRHEDAIIVLQQALKINPQDIGVLNNYGNALNSLDRHEDAIIVLQQALKINPQEIGTLHNYGKTFIELHRYQEAIVQFEKILELSKDKDLYSLLILGILYYRCHLKNEGERYFQSVIEYSDDKDVAKIAIAQEMFAQDHYSEKGVAILQEITETSPHYQEAFRSLKLHLSPKEFFEMFNTRPAEKNALKDTGLLNRALYHKIANEIAILKETVYLLLSGYQINDPKLADILARIDAIFEGVKQRRAQEKANVQTIPAHDYDAILATISKTAHDISDFVNNKLAAIEERIRLILAQPSDNEMLLKKLNKMLTRIKISQNALNDLKSVNEGIKLRDSNFQIAELFEQWQQAPTFRHAAISLNIRNGDAIFYGDAEKIKSFLKELVENAVRHNPDKVDLQIEIASEDVVNPPVMAQSILSGERKFLLITVSNNGREIPSDKKEWIFLPLKTTSDEGSGLGLFIIQRTLKEMRGQIVETGTDGVRFEIYIPYKQGDESWNK